MGLRINQNIASLSAQNRLTKSTKKLNTALERLSSGLRINKGSDDVVGLLKSESLRSQVRGISQAQLNISNALNMLGVAEGTLNEITSITQQIREKAVQAADATISATDRSNITTAVNDLMNEYSRLVSKAEFDGTYLLDGTFLAKTFQVGPNSGDTVSLTLSDTRAAQVGKVAQWTSTAASVTGTDTTADPDFANSTTLTVGGVSISSSAFTADGVSNVAGADSAIAYVNAINAFSSQSGVSAQVISTVATLDYGAGGDAIGTADLIFLNGQTITGTAFSLDDTGATSLVGTINAMSTSTGVTASVDTTGNKVILTASDGRNIDFRVMETDAANNFFNMGVASDDTSIAFRGTFKLTSDSAFAMTAASLIGSAASINASLDSSTTFSNLSVSTASNSADAIDIMDAVIRQIQQRRSDVGSKTIRLEAADSELAIRKENLTAAESRIRDVDVAAETANMTSAQILQQAGIAVLAQANALPQVALSLLQG